MPAINMIKLTTKSIFNTVFFIDICRVVVTKLLRQPDKQVNGIFKIV